MTDISARPARTHPIEGWNEKRTHPDGHSYWRNGDLHRARGYAVDRDENRQVWLHGHHIDTPDFDPRAPLMFTGQSRTGRLTWADLDGAIRAETIINGADVHETRWYDEDGSPEEHWRGNYHVRRTLGTGEIRYYRQPDPDMKPLLHRVDGPAVEHPDTPIKSIWAVDGARVEGPLELLIRHTVRAQQAADHGRPIIRLDLTDTQKGRLRVTVINHPDTPLATDIAIAFPDEYHEAMTAIGSL